MKVWLMADTHFGYKGDDDEWLEDYIGYFENTLIPLMKTRVQPDDILIHCGDVFDNRSQIGLNTINRTIIVFEKFSEIFSDIRIIVGNHDSMKKTSNDVTSVNVLKYIPNVKIYYNPKVEIIDGKKCLFNPWIEDIEKEKRLLQSVDVEYIFGHLVVGGSLTTNRAGVKIDIGAGVSIKDFKNAQVYAGHIHIRQDNKNVHYIGNPYHKDRGDRNNSKGVTVLDIQTGKTEFIENMISPRYLKESVYDILNLTVSDLKERWKNNRIDLHMLDTDYTRCNFDDLISCLSGCYREFKPHGDITNVPMIDTLGESDFEDAKTSENYIDEFLEQQDMSDEFKERIKIKLDEYKERL